MVNDLLEFLLEYKKKMDYSNLDFNADKVHFYKKIRLKMAGKYCETKEILLRRNLLRRDEKRDDSSTARRVFLM